jgi:hypothetical protein
VSAQKLGQLHPFIAAFQPECTGQLASFGPNLAPFSPDQDQSFIKRPGDPISPAHQDNLKVRQALTGSAQHVQVGPAVFDCKSLLEP